MPAVEAPLVSGPGSHPALIGRTSSPEALRILRALVLEEAEERATAMRAIGDPVLSASEEAELAAGPPARPVALPTPRRRAAWPTRRSEGGRRPAASTCPAPPKRSSRG